MHGKSEEIKASTYFKCQYLFESSKLIYTGYAWSWFKYGQI